MNQTWSLPTGAHGLENTYVVIAVRLEEHHFLCVKVQILEPSTSLWKYFSLLGFFLMCKIAVIPGSH